MKKLIISALLVPGFLIAHAQESMPLQTLNYTALEKKMVKSDEDIKDEKKNIIAKTWLARGELFQDINDVNTEYLRYGMAVAEVKLYRGEPKEIKTLEEGGVVKQIYVYDRINLAFENEVLTGWEETQVIHPTPLTEALAAYTKALELDVKGSLDKKIKDDLERLKRQFESKAIDCFNKEDYTGSLTAFEGIMETSKTRVYNGYIDTVAVYNAALAARNAGQHQKAIEYFRKAIDVGYGGSDAYYLLKNEYITVNDSNAAIMALEEGFQRYPDTTLILIEIVNFYLTSGNVEKGLQYLELAEQKEADNPSIYFVKGTLFEKMGDKEKAMEAYKKAVEVDPEYFNAYFNIGVLYFNYAVELYEYANTLEDLKAYNEAKLKADEAIKKAIEPMEKAHQINPTDRGTLETLQTIYYRLQLMDKYEEVKKKLSEL